MNYAPGLKIEWSDKELAKIREIKNRPRHLQYHKTIPWGDEEFILRIEKKRAKCKAIRLLDFCGIEADMIAGLFEMQPSEVREILR